MDAKEFFISQRGFDLALVREIETNRTADLCAKGWRARILARQAICFGSPSSWSLMDWLAIPLVLSAHVLLNHCAVRGFAVILLEANRGFTRIRISDSRRGAQELQ
jgi:hypothetical protein